MRTIHLGAREMEEVEEVMKHDFKAAVEVWEFKGEPEDGMRRAQMVFEGELYETIRAALLLADRLTQNPSTAMLAAAQNAWLNDPTRRSSTVFKAMVEALMKDVEQ